MYRTQHNIEIFNIRWLFLATASVIGIISCLGWSASSQYMGEFFPIGGDSFYHAVRIMHLFNNGQLLQFDPGIHAPEGSIIVWPWAYDTLATIYLVLIKNITGSNFPDMEILLSFPVTLFLLSLLILSKLLKHLELNTANYALCLICYSLSPLVQGLYGYGRIDHHGAEQVALITAILMALRWIKNSVSAQPAIWLGVVLGGAISLHTSLLVLQIPVGVYIAISWLKIQVPAHTAKVGLSTFITTLLLAIPSYATQELLFQFSTFSWFHVYISAGFMFFCLYIARERFSAMKLLLLGMATIAFAIPIYMQSPAYDYLSGELYSFSSLVETRSPLQGAQALGLSSLMEWYSGLIYLTPVVFAWALWGIFHANRVTRLIAVFSLFGLLMSAIQFRFFVFGLFPLVVVTFYILDKHVSIKDRYIWLYFSFMLISTQIWSSFQLTRVPPTANDADFRIMYPAFKAMNNLCEKGNKTMLAASNDGHYIRYFSECRVISNTFLLTPQHEQKTQLVHEMFELGIHELMERYPWVDYIFVRAYPSDVQRYPDLSKLKAEVLLSKAGNARIISQSKYQVTANGHYFPAYRLIELIR